MSAYEETSEVSRSKVVISRNAKGDPQWTVQVVAGATEDDLNELRRIAIAQHQALLTEIA